MMRLYDRFTFGDLIEISMIDGRQYRSREACYAPPDKGGMHLETNASCPERLRAGRTHDGLCARRPGSSTGSRARKAQWNLIAQDVLMAQYQRQAERSRRRSRPTIGTAIRRTVRACSSASTRRRSSNPVVLSGDIHSFFANDLKLDFDDPTLAGRGDRIRRHLDLVHGPPYDSIAQALPDNPHVHFFESRRRGYVWSISSARTCRCACASSPTPPTPRRTSRR